MIYRRTIAASCLLVLLPFLTTSTVSAFSLVMSKNLIDIANFALSQSPSSTRFITNKMCPYAQKVWIALEVANAPYEMEEVALYGPDGKPDWFLELNPKGEVPVLVIFGGARILRDSDLILDEIQKVGNGTSLVPSDRKAASKATGFRALLSEFLPLGKAAVLEGGNKAKMWSKLKELDSNIEGPYICGEQVTIADCAAFPFLWRIDSEFGPLEKEGCSNIRAWLDHCPKNPGFAKTIAQGAWWWWW